MRVVARGSDAAALLESMPQNGELAAYALDCLFRSGRAPTFYAADDAAASRYALKIDAWGFDDYPVGLVKLA